MSPIAPALAALGAEIKHLTAQFGEPVDVAAMGVTDRAGHLRLGRPGLCAPNGACRMVRTRDGWIAVNLARAEDIELVPAWLGCGPVANAWGVLEKAARQRGTEALLAGAILLGLPVAKVGEVTSDTLRMPTIAMGAPLVARFSGRLRVVDLSALWAGPLCGAILARAGAQVSKYESVIRPDPTATATPEFFDRLNGEKSLFALDFSASTDQARLRKVIASADILITSARPRAFSAIGLSPEQIFADNPNLTWIAITGYGWTGEAAARVAFGDDAAAAGGLVGWTKAGAPRFLGDALADPLTGLAAAAEALRAVQAGGGVLVDMAMAGCAARAAAIQ